MFSTLELGLVLPEIQPQAGLEGYVPLAGLELSLCNATVMLTTQS